MATIAIIISIIALAGAGFAFIRASSSHHILGKRIEDLKERVKYLEASQNRGQSRNKQTIEQPETGRRNQPKQEPQENRQRQEPQEARVNQPREEREPRQRPTRQEQRQKKRERQQDFQEEAQATDDTTQQQQQQQRRRKDNRRRNEPGERPANYEEPEREQQLSASDGINFEIVGGHLLDEMEQNPVVDQPIVTPEPQVVADSGIRFAIIPEDGVIRQHQLQQRPDSDSYIEIDVPAEGSNQTRYRFNLSGNHAFVISQGIDRLENAFDFEKPSNRMVTKVVQQQDGVLAKVNNGWRIQEKARIDFR